MKRGYLFLLVGALWLLPADLLAQQAGTIEGRVTHRTTGESIPGANVIIEGLGIGAATDVEGRYELTQVPYGTHQLQVTFLGFRTYRATVELNEPRLTHDIRMQEDLVGLDEIVVVGYGVRERRELAGSVSRVEAREFENLPVTTTEQLFQGRTAGVHVTTSSGVAGSSVAVRVRGPSSVHSGNQPLYVVDGVPIITGNVAGNIGQGTNALSHLNPNDIESIEVLKDASATAIYGSRGANGVVLITTRRGRAQGFTDVTASYYTGWTDATFRWDILSGPEWVGVYREAFDNRAVHFHNRPDLVGTLETALGYPALPSVGDAPDHRIVDEAFRTGQVHNMHLAAAGGDATTRYYFSGAYHETQGYIIENRFRRLVGKLTLDHNPSDWAQIGASLNLVRALNDRAPSDNLVAGTLTSSALRPPILPVRTDDGDWNMANPWNIAANSVAVAHLNRYETTDWRTFGEANVTIDIPGVDGLSLRGMGGFDMMYIDEYYRYSERTGDGSGGGFGSQAYRDTRNWIVNSYAQYVNQFRGGHRLNALAGIEFQRNLRKNVIASARGFISDIFPNVGAGANPTTTFSSTDAQWGLESYFGRATYTFEDRYIAEFSARMDGSSRFGRDYRYGFFPAGALAWRASEENFLANTQWLDELKFRVSFGMTGNDQIGTFPSLGLFASGWNYGGLPGLAPNQLANPELRWESTTSLDIGLDMALFDGRVFLTTDFYRKNTDDLLLPVQVPWSTGYTSVVQNVGSMYNQGIELALEAFPVRGDFTWSVRMNATYNRNEVTELVGDEDVISGFQRARVGEPLGSFYLIRWHGVDPETGRPQWLDADGEPTFSPSAATDAVIAGKVDPDWFGGFGSTLSFRGLVLDAFFTFQTGADLYNDTKRFMMTPATWNLHRDFLNRWQQPGDITDVPRAMFADTDQASRASTRWLEDASYLRLADLTLSYNLPPALLQDLRLRSARIFVQGRNLATWSRVSVGDPEASYSGAVGALNRGESFFTPPQQRAVQIGLSLNL